MTKITLFSVLCFVSSLANANCLSKQQLASLAEQETQYLQQKVPPAFTHAIADSKIMIKVDNKQADQCLAEIKITLPESDIKEANAILDSQPAKKIMLAAQGQSLPQTPINLATFNVDANALAIAEADQLQTAALGKLRASIELMYALITQQRAQIQPNQTNAIAWTEQDIAKVTSDCGAQNSAGFCQCMASEYAQSISPNQMDYIQYIRTNPYALATGVNQQFELIKQAAEQSCKG